MKGLRSYEPHIYATRAWHYIAYDNEEMTHEVHYEVYDLIP